MVRLVAPEHVFRISGQSCNSQRIYIDWVGYADRKKNMAASITKTVFQYDISTELKLY